MEHSPNVVLDVETFPNAFMVGLLDIESERYVCFQHNELPRLAKWVKRVNPYFIGFNSAHYDLRLLKFALDYPTDVDLLSKLKMFNDHIIVEPDQLNKDVWDQFYWQESNCDLKSVLGGRNCPSLKKIAYRLHWEEIESLPIQPNQEVSEEEKQVLIKYNELDCRNTLKLWYHCQEALQLRQSLSKIYDIDLMSCSDSQIAEKVLTSNMPRPEVFDEHERPMSVAIKKEYSFDSHQLKVFYNKLMNCGLKIKHYYLPATKRHGYKKHFVFNKEDKESFTLNEIQPNILIGFGGAHSIHKHCQEVEDCWEVDVASYYPHLILRHKLFAGEIGKRYEEILERRLLAKKENRKIEAEASKIILNSSFGHCNNHYSKLRDPKAGAAICLNGQLSILRLMDLCWSSNIQVLLTNTDGILTTRNPSKAVALWQKEMDMPLEVKHVRKAIIKDSNNHILQYDDEKLKIKGVAFAYEKSISKQLNYPIINKALVDLLINQTPIAKTIKNCNDAFMFCACYAKGPTIKEVKLSRSVEEKGIDLPAISRYYLSSKSENQVFKRNAKNWTRVADTDGIVIANKITGFPEDIDYEKYINKTEKKIVKIRK